MQAQGQLPFNKAYFDALSARVNRTTDCSELQDLIAEAFASIQAQSDAITSQLAAITPLLALLNVPNSLGSLISWVGNFITSFLKPYLKPQITYALQLAELAAAIAELKAAIQQAAGNIKFCTVTVPAVTTPPIPSLPGGL